MNAWARAAGKLARYEHIGWNEWPHSLRWAFHSGSIAIRGSSTGRSSASWTEAVGAIGPSSAAARRSDRARVTRRWAPVARPVPGRWAAEYSTPSGRAGRLQVDRAHEGEHEEDHYEQPEQARPARVVGAESVAIAVAESAIQQAGDNQRDEQQGHLAKTIASRPCVDWATATTSP